MEVPADVLRNIHMLHCRIRSLRERIERGPRQLEARRARVKEAEQELEALNNEIKQLKVRAHDKETQRLAMENRVKDLHNKLMQAKSNEEYSALMAERDSVKAAAGALEDEILELLFRQDDLAEKRKEKEAELQRMKKELEEFERALLEERGGLTNQLHEAEQELREAEQKLPLQLYEEYQRILSSRGHEALAPVEQNSCTGCFTTITAQMKNLLLANELVFCSSCGRILYLNEKSVASKQ